METITYLDSLHKQLKYYKELADQAMAQIPKEALFWQYNAESNSIAILLHHMSGNMRSRFTEFLTSDGEKSWRNRDAEFVVQNQDPDALLQDWEDAWQILWKAIEEAKGVELHALVYIRNEGHTILEAFQRQLCHYAYHIGQIVFLAKMICNEQWQSLSIPRNQSEQYNAQKFAQEKERKHFTDNP